MNAIPADNFATRFSKLLARGRELDADFRTSGDNAQSRAAILVNVYVWLSECVAFGRLLPDPSGDRTALQSRVDYWSSLLAREGHEFRGVGRLADFDAASGIPLFGDCPYPGLEPYTETRCASFFGREGVIVECVAHLEDPSKRILLIIGGSGSGKSSLALAGVLPRLQEHHQSDWLFAPPFTPGVRPLASLGASVVSAIGHPDQEDAVIHGLAAAPGKALAQFAKLCRGKPLMLLIDQFEELLTLCRDTNEQECFATVLCALSAPAASLTDFSCRILLTLRTDHLARFESSNAMMSLHMRLVGERNELYLSGIGFEEIRRAIAEPAKQSGLRFESEDLIDQLASQTAGLSNGLPLLQFALRRLWDTRPTNKDGEPLDLITKAMVDALPDVQQALGKVADDLFNCFSPTQEQVCERLLLELVVLDESFEEPLRRRRNESELREVLLARFPVTGDVDRVVGDFVEAGLLRRFGEGPDRQLEVAHEALLRRWDHIYRLISGAEVKERLHLVKQVSREASEWANRGRMDGYLNLRGERLHRAMTYAEDGWIDAESTEYIEACSKQGVADRLKEQRAKEEKERADAAEKAREEAELRAERSRRNMYGVAAIAGLILAVVLASLWFKAYNESVAKSKESLAQKLAMASEGELDYDFSQRSLLLAIEAAQHGKTAEGRLLPGVERALRSAIRASSVRGLITPFGGTLIYSAAYTPDGSTVALGDSLGGVSLWDVSTGRERKALFAHVDAVKTIAFSPDGRTMASGSDDGKVVVWDVERGEPVHVLSAHVDQVNGLAFSRPDGRLLASASDDGSVRLWDVSTGKQVRVLYGHAGAVMALAFGRDERQLATAGKDQRVILWDARSGRVLYSLPAQDLFDIDLSADGSWLAVARQTKVEIWDTATRGRRWALTGQTNSMLQVRFSRDQRQVAATSYDGTVRVWQLPRDDGDPPAHEVQTIRFPPETALFTSLAFSPKGDMVTATALIRRADSDLWPVASIATIWNLTGGGELVTLKGYESAVRAIGFGPDGKTITAVGGGDRPVQTWDMSGTRVDTVFDGPQIHATTVTSSGKGILAFGDGNDVLVAQPGVSAPLRLSGHKRVVNDLAFSPDGSRLVSASEDTKAIVWELPSGKLLKVLDGHKESVTAVAFSADGNTIATGSEDMTIRLWQTRTWEPQEIRGHLLGILDLAFTADSQKLVSTGRDKMVRIWDVTTGAGEDIFRGHTDIVYEVAIAGDNLATAADDGIRLWDLRSRTPVAVFPVRSHGARSVAFSPHGDYLAAGTSDGVIRVYAMQAESLVQMANSRIRRGWTSNECKQFLQGKPCPQSRYTLLDEANQHFENLDFTKGERLLQQAKGSESADAAELIHAETDVRLGTALLWAASRVLADPEFAAGLSKDKKPEELAHRILVVAKEKSNALVFDPRSRWNDLRAYGAVTRARELARKGKLQESVAVFEEVRAAGWDAPGEPETVASQLFGIAVLSKVPRDPQILWSTPKDQVQVLTSDLERALRGFPDLGPGHGVLAELYETQQDLASAKKYYDIEANSKESSAEPLVRVAWMESERNPQQAVTYAKKALERDAGSDEAWIILGFAEHARENEREAVKAFDQVSPFSDRFPQALNTAAAIYFERLGDDQSAYQRLTRAVQLTPNDFMVLSNYAEFLLASGRYNQARVAATRAHEHVEAQRPENADSRAALSFVLFGAEFFAGERGDALFALDALEKDVKAAAASLEKNSWEFHGIERSLKGMRGAGSREQRRALLKVLQFVRTNGREGTLDDIRHVLDSQPPSG